VNDTLGHARGTGDRLTKITLASGSTATFSFDALGRFKTRVLNGTTTETYSYGFLVFDLHGDVAAAETAAQNAYAAAIRYDPYGQTADTYDRRVLTLERLQGLGWVHGSDTRDRLPGHRRPDRLHRISLRQ